MSSCRALFWGQHKIVVCLPTMPPPTALSWPPSGTLSMIWKWSRKSRYLWSRCKELKAKGMARINVKFSGMKTVPFCSSPLGRPTGEPNTHLWALQSGQRSIIIWTHYFKVHQTLEIPYKLITTFGTQVAVWARLGVVSRLAAERWASLCHPSDWHTSTFLHIVVALLWCR